MALGRYAEPRRGPHFSRTDDHLHPRACSAFPSMCRFTSTAHVVADSSRTWDLQQFMSCRRVTWSIWAKASPPVQPIPARPSAEGTEQCCFIIDSADATVLDAVDILDALETREALLPHRQAVDLAFVPTGASVQWQGFWNQMDPLNAVSFCEWLQPTHVAPCGGSLSLADQPRLGTLSRYPVDFKR